MSAASSMNARAAGEPWRSRCQTRPTLSLPGSQGSSRAKPGERPRADCHAALLGSERGVSSTSHAGRVTARFEPPRGARCYKAGSRCAATTLTRTWATSHVSRSTARHAQPVSSGTGRTSRSVMSAPGIRCPPKRPTGLSRPEASRRPRGWAAETAPGALYSLPSLVSQSCARLAFRFDVKNRVRRLQAPDICLLRGHRRGNGTEQMAASVCSGWFGVRSCR
jgi:hypothetical protein